MDNKITTLPPNNIDAEKFVLGSMLIDKDIIIKISGVLTANDFYKDAHKYIYKAMFSLFEERKDIDILAVKTILEKDNQLVMCGGTTYLASLTNEIGTTTKCLDHAQEVKKTSVLRRTLRILSDSAAEIYSNEDTDVVSKTQSKLVGLADNGKEKSSVKEIIHKLTDIQQEYAEKYARGEKYMGIPTGFEKLDNAIDGLRKGHLWIVGAWTSTGKTQFAMNVVSNVLHQNIPVSVISLEMSDTDTIARILGMRLGISALKILKGRIDGELWDKIEAEKNILYNSPLTVHTNKFELDKIKSTIRNDVYEHKVRLVVLDYVQNIMSSEGKKEYDLITKSIYNLQALAKELGITIYVVSQISNEAEKGQAAGAGFKGSGGIEAAADLAIRLKRNKSLENELDNIVPVQAVISKSRHGLTGVIDYNMTLKSGKFEEVKEIDVEQAFKN